MITHPFQLRSYYTQVAIAGMRKRVRDESRF